MDKRLLASVIKSCSLEQVENFLEKMEIHAVELLTDMLLKPDPPVEDPVKPVVEDHVKPPVEEELPYETKYHHTSSGSSDGGTSLVMCPNHFPKFDKVVCNGVVLPFRGFDGGRETYWNMFKVVKGDIIAVKDGKSYKFPCLKTMTYGKCE